MEVFLCLVGLGIIIFCYKAAKNAPPDQVIYISKKKPSHNSLIEGMVLGEMISNNTQENSGTKLEQSQDPELDSCESLEDFQDL